MDEFIPKYLTAIEQELLPLFEYLQYPDKIEFEDQILKVVETFIKAG